MMGLRLARLIAGLMAALMLTASPLPAADRKLVTVETFSNSGAKLLVGHFTLPNVEKSQSKVGLIGIASPNYNSFAFDYEEWLELIELAKKAIDTKSTSWTIIGSMSETGTEDVSELTVSGGPGLNLMITSRKAGTAVYGMDKADLPRFQKGLGEVKEYLAQ